jgi:hypothetical protein
MTVWIAIQACLGWPCSQDDQRSGPLFKFYSLEVTSETDGLGGERGCRPLFEPALDGSALKVINGLDCYFNLTHWKLHERQMALVVNNGVDRY